MISTRRPAPMLGLIALLTAVTLLAAPAALAGGKQFPTFFTKFKYTLKDGDAEFKGAIDSSKGGCVGDRKVVLYRPKVKLS
jgi:hypothetical protein